MGIFSKKLNVFLGKSRNKNQKTNVSLWEVFMGFILGTRLKYEDNNKQKWNIQIISLVTTVKHNFNFLVCSNHGSLEIYNLSEFIIQPVLFKCPLTFQNCSQTNSMDLLVIHSGCGYCPLCYHCVLWQFIHQPEIKYFPERILSSNNCLCIIKIQIIFHQRLYNKWGRERKDNNVTHCCKPGSKI